MSNAASKEGTMRWVLGALWVLAGCQLVDGVASLRAPGAGDVGADPSGPEAPQDPGGGPSGGPSAAACALAKDCASSFGEAGAGCVWDCVKSRCQRVGRCAAQNDLSCRTEVDCLNPLPDCAQARWSCEGQQCKSYCGQGTWPAGCKAAQVELPTQDKCSCKCADCDCSKLDCTCPSKCYSDPTGCFQDPFFPQNKCVRSCVPENDLSTQMVCSLTCDIQVTSPPSNPPVLEVPSLPPEQCGLTVDPSQRLVLDLNDTTQGGRLSYIWIANSSDGTLSKVDTATGVERARYYTGPSNQSDPSRTTVSLSGDVVVANRARSSGQYASATRIHADPSRCPDRNGNGVIETSTGPGQVLPWGQDECVLWHRPFAAGSIPRAAAFDYGACADVCGKASETVWIGLHDASQVVQLDAATGNVLHTIALPGHKPYGMAFDHACNLWVTDWSGDSTHLVRIDVKTRQWESVASSPGCRNYGIAVDSKSRVWTTGENGCVSRYDQQTKTWKSIFTTGVNRKFNRGLASDGVGSMWVSETELGMHRIAEDSMQVLADIPLGTAGSRSFVGAAVDFQGMVWAVDQTGAKAHRIDPTSLATLAVSVGRGPYTYSDMTGFQLYNVSRRGYLRTAVQACTAVDTWESVRFSAQVPPGTSFQLRARAGNTVQDIQSRTFAVIATVPPDASPRDLKAALEAAVPGSSKGLLLQLDLNLYSDQRGVSPAVTSLEVLNSGCPQPLEASLVVP